MQAYSEVLPPTAVTHALFLPFLRPNRQNLVVVKTSLLQIFDLKRVKSSHGDFVPSDNDAESDDVRLALVAEYPLSAIVTSLVPVRVPNTRSGAAALMLSFMDAKATMIQWDPKLHGLLSIEIHSYETQLLQADPFETAGRRPPSYLTVDPGNRCVAMKFGRHHLALIALGQGADDLVDDDASKADYSARVQHKSVSSSLPMTQLDPSLAYPLDLAFLYEYHEPTIGVLAEISGDSTNINDNTTTYMVFTLDLEQQARTTLLSIDHLPSDLWCVVPLPLPIGGSLLVGDNVLVHIDQSGKHHAVGVNEFARNSSSRISIADQSDLAIRLESCKIVKLDQTTGLLLILNDGQIVHVSFQIEGRTVSGLTVSLRSDSLGLHTLRNGATCATSLGSSFFFVGGRGTDASLVQCASEGSDQLSRTRSRPDTLAADVDISDEEVEDEDDLYGDNSRSNSGRANKTTVSLEQIRLRLVDHLPNLGAVSSPVKRSRPYSAQATALKGSAHIESEELVLPVGSGLGGGLALLKNHIDCKVFADFAAPKTRDIWALSIKPSDSHDEQRINYAIVAHDLDLDSEKTSIHKLTKDGLTEVEFEDFLSDLTLDVGTILNGLRIVLVSANQLRSYNSDFGIEQVWYDEQNTDPNFTHTCFCDPYVLIMREDESFNLLRADKNGELEEVKTENLSTRTWKFGSIYKTLETGPDPCFYLVDTKGNLEIYCLSDLSNPVYKAEGLENLPLNLLPGEPPRKSNKREEIAEILATEIGDSSYKTLCLVVRYVTNEISVYEPYSLNPAVDGFDFNNLGWARTDLQQSLPPLRDTDLSMYGPTYATLMKAMPNLGRHSCVYIGGSLQKALVKEASASPKLVSLSASKTKAATPVSFAEVSNGMLIVDSSDHAFIASPSDSATYETGFGLTRLFTDGEVDQICYDQETDHFVLACTGLVEFVPRVDEFNQDSQSEATDLRCMVSESTIRLLNGESKAMLETMYLEDFETVTTMLSAHLEVSEITHERRRVIAIGTAVQAGEDQPASGTLIVVEVIRVVPKPDDPASGYRMRAISKQDVKGAVTALAEVSNHGYLAVAQGQKVMIRGVKEDGSNMPVAFIDFEVYTTVLKNLPNESHLLFGDLFQGLMVGGFVDEPYEIKLTGKSSKTLSVRAADFLPYQREESLFLVAADDDQNLHILEYNPANPNSFNGTRLIHRSSFFTGYNATSFTLVAHTDEDEELTSKLLMTTDSGALVVITNISEPTYRRLFPLQSHLTSILNNYAALNPREFRVSLGVSGITPVGAAESAGSLAGGLGGVGTTRTMLDMGLIRRWRELNTARRAEAFGRVGEEATEEVEDLMRIGPF